MDKAQVDELIAAQNTVGQRVYDRARTILSPDQLDTWGKYQTNRMQMMRMGMNMARKMFAPDKPAALSPLAVRDPNMEVLPAVNPAGHSFTPVQSGISKPTGIMPLRGITSPYALPATPRPAGQAQPPPWLSDSPSPFSPPPQRIF